MATSDISKSPLYIDSANNRVGVGTASPNKSSSSTALTVDAPDVANYAALELSSGETLNWYINANNAAVYDVTAGTRPRVFYTNGSERMRIDGATGNVGIGTATTNYGKFTAQNTAGTGKVLLDDFQSVPTTENVLSIHADSSNGYIQSYNNGWKNIIIAPSGGNVGIGGSETTVFNGYGGDMKFVVIGNDSTTTIANNSDAGIAVVNTNQTAGNLAGLHFARADTDDSPNYAGASIVAQFPEAQVTGQYPKGDLAFLTSTAANNAPSEKMRLTAAGSVGIGVAPSELLHIKNASGDAAVRIDGNTRKFKIEQNNYGLRFVDVDAGSAERLRIDAAGRVKMPYQPAFTASGGGSPSQGAGVLQYSSTSQDGFNLNVGGHYNTSNYRFTAPVSGNYFFCFNAYTDSSNNFDASFYINGGTKGPQIQDLSTRTGSNTYVSLSASIIMPLSANDYVHLQTTYRAYIDTNCFFSGYLMS